MHKDYSYLEVEDKVLEKVDFFHDFIVFLRYLEKQPIKLTLTGNISLYDIGELSKILKTVASVKNKFDQFGWKIASERYVETLTQIKIIADVMRLVYKRKKKLFLSCRGKDYLSDLHLLSQYWDMVLNFWERVNWAYFSPGREVDGKMIAEVLQDHQDLIWDALLKKEGDWIDFSAFCQTLREYLHLRPFYESGRFEYSDLYSDITYGLFYRNLSRFGCVEIEEEKNEHGIERIVRFRSTNLGLSVFEKALS